MIYFNNAATSFPKPASVIRAVAENLKTPPSNPHRENVTAAHQQIQCRDKIAAFFNFPYPQRVILCSGATDALNMAINGILKPQNHVITTQIEHNAVLRPLYHLRDNGSIALTIIDCCQPGRVYVKKIAASIAPETRLVVIGHASNVTGALQDIDSIYHLCAQHNIPLLIDMSQSAGAVAIDTAEFPLAIWAFTGHKSLLGPQGTGGLLIGEAIDLIPWRLGGTGIHSDLESMPNIWPLKYEAGTPNTPGLAGLTAAIDYLQTHGIKYFADKKVALSRHLCEELLKLPETVLFAEAPDNNCCGVVSFNIKGWSPDDIGYILQNSFDIRIRTGLHCAPLVHHALGTFPQGTIRVSFSAFNQHDEIDELMRALQSIIK